MTDEARDPDEDSPEDVESPASSEPDGTSARWTLPLLDGRPQWNGLERVLADIPLAHRFRWVGAHQLGDGRRLDEFICRGTMRRLLLDEHGGAWVAWGWAPGAVGRAVLVAPGRRDVVVAALATPYAQTGVDSRDDRQDHDTVDGL